MTILGDYQPLIFVDFEASGLDQPDSYPIQVAWGSDPNDVCSYYITPEPNWNHWDLVAENDIQLMALISGERSISIMAKVYVQQSNVLTNELST